jgi:hypothetical protein
VARKEHGEFSSNIDLIDTLPPGLYEAVFEDKTANLANPDLAGGEWVMRCEARTLDDLRAMGGNDAADDRRFAAAARLSEINLSLYRTFLQPSVRALVSTPFADSMRRLHSLRLQYELLADANPMMAPIARFAEQVRERRMPVSSDNPLIALQEHVSEQIVTTLDAWRQFSETLAESTFEAVFGSPAMQAALGIDPAEMRPQNKAPKNPLHDRLLGTRIAELKSNISAGGPREAIVRAIIYIGMARNAVDERGFEMTRRIREAHGDMSISEFKAMVREQSNMLLIDQDAALAAISKMLPDRLETRRGAFRVITQVIGARGALSDEDHERLDEVAHLFGVADQAVTSMRSPRHARRHARAS